MQDRNKTQRTLEISKYFDMACQMNDCWPEFAGTYAKSRSFKSVCEIFMSVLTILQIHVTRL